MSSGFFNLKQEQSDDYERNLPEIPWYMNLAAKSSSLFKDCPADIKDDISFFLDHGYVLLKNSTPMEVIKKARFAFMRHKEKYKEVYSRHEDANGFQRRIVNLHMAIEEFMSIWAQNDKALKLQDYLFQRESTCYTTLTFESGSEQDIHRDSPYFSTVPEYYYLGVWIALERVDGSNGALEVIDGGHLVQEEDRFSIFQKYYKQGDQVDEMDNRLWSDYQKAVLNSCTSRGLVKHIVPMEPGDTLIWHPHLPHGGASINSPGKSRLSIVNHVVPRGTPVYGLDVFFKNKIPTVSPELRYVDHFGRKFLIHQNVEFQHRDPQPATTFRI
jgi:phytanoyl-CoA hydroxylase